ncbi:ABC transporter ATP-binding protein [Mycoplana ramosa]|uniref:ABC transporter ATP-binding protein n=1 Tax=Mycoplana ramosa TaxID=40837 RepID=A0ABW3YVS4_MYCRA
MAETLLSIRNLRLDFGTARGDVSVLRGIDLDLAAGEVTALVGESGSGKSALGKSILGLHAPPFVASAASMQGSIHLQDEELLGAPPERLRHLRAREVALVSQEALSGLNPVMRVGPQIAEAAQAANHELSPTAAERLAREMIAAVGLPEPDARYRAYPHQLSGGQRQRVIIAIAAIRQPKLMIADEPTTALDVTVQARILDLLRALQARHGMAMLFITHDLGVVAQIAQHVAVMYAGRIVERGPLADVFTRPRHPYTAGLIAALPEAPTRTGRLDGHPPDPATLSDGCAFAPRCPRATAVCSTAPPKRTLDDSTLLCWNPIP